MNRKSEIKGERLFGEWCEGKNGRINTRGNQLRCKFDNGKVLYSEESIGFNDTSGFLIIEKDNGSWVESTDPEVRYNRETGYLHNNNGDILFYVNEGRITDINKKEFDSGSHL